MKYPQQKKTQSIFLHHCCCSGSASGEEIADGVDLHSPDGLLEPVLLSSVTKPPPKSPTKSGSGKKKSYTAGPTKATRVAGSYSVKQKNFLIVVRLCLASHKK